MRSSTGRILWALLMLIGAVACLRAVIIAWSRLPLFRRPASPGILPLRTSPGGLRSPSLDESGWAQTSLLPLYGRCFVDLGSLYGCLWSRSPQFHALMAAVNAPASCGRNLVQQGGFLRFLLGGGEWSMPLFCLL